MNYNNKNIEININLSKKFMNGLKEKKITYKELIDYYVYCGGLTNIDRSFSPDYYDKYYNTKDYYLDSRHFKYLNQYFNNKIPYNRFPIYKNLKSFYKKDERIKILFFEYKKQNYDIKELFTEESCVCKTPIKHLCFLHNKDYKNNTKPEYLLIGSCCITKFMPDGLTKTCSNCGEIHQNRKDNFCNDCREYLKEYNEVSEWEIRFGKHKGKLYDDISLDYLQILYNKGCWDNTNYSSNAKIKRYIEYRINQSNS